jgi:hypothetical protein
MILKKYQNVIDKIVLKLNTVLLLTRNNDLRQ